MPAEQRGFLFRFFDKAACAVAVLGLILVLLYVFAQGKADDLQVIVRQVAEARNQLDRRRLEAPPENPAVNFEAKLKAASDVGDPPAETRDVLDYLWPLDLGTRRVGLEKDYVMDLRLAVRKVSKERWRDDDLLPRGVDIVHPHEGDYRKVLVKTGRDEGKLRLTGTARDRNVLLVLVVDRHVDARPDAPLGVSARARGGVVEITFKADPKNQERGIRVEKYELQRKELGATAQAFRTVQNARWTQDNRTRVHSLQDASVKPNRTYAYTVVAVAPTSEPRKSEPTEVIEITAQPDVDFRLVGGSGGAQVAAKFEAVNGRSGANFKHALRRSVGDEIGDSLSPEYEVRFFRTGCYLVDYQSSVMRVTRRWINVGSEKRELTPKVEVKSRVVYADTRGALRVLWKDEENVPYLWERSVPVRKRKKGAPDLPDDRRLPGESGTSRGYMPPSGGSGGDYYYDR